MKSEAKQKSLAILTGVLISCFCAYPAGGTVTITEYTVPPMTGTGPMGITSGPDGALWFTLGGSESNGGIGRIDPKTHAVTEYATPTSGSDPLYITSGPDSALWFTEWDGNQIGRIDPATHVITEYAIPTSNSHPAGITSGADGALWFTETIGGKIGRINPTTHAITEYATPTSAANPQGITRGPDGALWFTDGYANQIGRIDPKTHVITEYVVPTSDSYPQDITSGPDGALWFTEWSGNQIGSINAKTQAITEYAIPTSDSEPDRIISGPDGALWFTEWLGGTRPGVTGGNQIGRLDPKTHVVTEYATPTSPSDPDGITSGPDGALWFAEAAGDQVGRVAFAPTDLTALVAGGAIFFNQSNGQIIYCEENSFPLAPPTANCNDVIGTYPSSDLFGNFQLTTNGGIVAYITNLSTGHTVLCGSGTNNTTWHCTHIR